MHWDGYRYINYRCRTERFDSKHYRYNSNYESSESPKDSGDTFVEEFDTPVEKDDTIVENDKNIENIDDMNSSSESVSDFIDKNNEETEDEDFDDEEFDDEEDDESLMVVTEGTSITGSIGTSESMLILGTVNGDITCEGKLTISGKVVGNSFATDVFVNSNRVEGNIGCTGLLKISHGTVVIGDITASAAAIAGAVKGNLDINGPVILDSTAVIKGNIKAKSVQLINGAVLEGFCSLEYSDSQLDQIFES